MKSLPIPVAQARHNFSDVVLQARAGQRIRLTRHGKSVAWIVGSADREALSSPAPRLNAKRARPRKR